MKKTTRIAYGTPISFYVTGKKSHLLRICEDIIHISLNGRFVPYKVTFILLAARKRTPCFS